jgi:hypothetical protein
MACNVAADADISAAELSVRHVCSFFAWVRSIFPHLVDMAKPP